MFVDEVQPVAELVPVQFLAEVDVLRRLSLLIVERLQLLGIVAMYVLIKLLQAAKQLHGGNQL